MNTLKVVGKSDEVTTCECCGKSNLKLTVMLMNEEGHVVYYGSDCAGAALFGKKDRKNGERARTYAFHHSNIVARMSIHGLEDVKRYANIHGVPLEKKSDGWKFQINGEWFALAA